jgi:hypothetical protein
LKIPFGEIDFDESGKTCHHSFFQLLYMTNIIIRIKQSINKFFKLIKGRGEMNPLPSYAEISPIDFSLCFKKIREWRKLTDKQQRKEVGKYRHLDDRQKRSSLIISKLR